jgi:hypothetical protein
MASFSREVIFELTENEAVLKWNVVANRRSKPVSIKFAKAPMTPKEL